MSIDVVRGVAISNERRACMTGATNTATPDPHWFPVPDTTAVTP